MRVSSHAEQYLLDRFGRYWRTVGLSPCYSHVTHKAIECKYFDLTSSLSGPAIPFPSDFPAERPRWNMETLQQYESKFRTAQ